MKTSTLTLCLILTLAAGCTIPNHKPYEERPVTDVLDAASVAKDTRKEALPGLLRDAPAPELDAWWQAFADEPLNRLLAKAYAANRNLAAARANLAAARATWRYQEGALWPQADLGADVSRNRTSHYGRAGYDRYSNYTLNASARWELDLFGKNTYLVDAAEAEAQASEADLKAMWVAVSADLATYYVELRTLQGRLMVAQDNLRLQQDNYDLLADRHASGLTTALVLSQAEYDLHNTAATIPALKAQITAAEDAIALLCGVAPGTLPPEIVDIPDFMATQAQTGDAREEGRKAIGLRPTAIPAAKDLNLDDGIPANAIRRRPDVYASERRLKAATDTLGSAKAERYPTVYISGNFGLDSVHLGDLFDWDSHVYGVGPGVTLPIFHGGQIVANIDIRTEQQKAALADYEHTVISALADIRDALSGCTQERQRLSELRQGVRAAQDAYEIAGNSYDAGIGDFFDLLDAQRQVLSLDDARVSSEGEIAKQQIALYRALCGGWQGEENEDTPAALFGGNAPSEPLLAPLAQPEAPAAAPAVPLTPATQAPAPAAEATAAPSTEEKPTPDGVSPSPDGVTQAR